MRHPSERFSRLAACRREKFQRLKREMQVSKESRKGSPRVKESVIETEKAVYSYRQARQNEVPIVA